MTENLHKVTAYLNADDTGEESMNTISGITQEKPHPGASEMGVKVQ
ncbi:MAG: hypothetical protein ACP5G0_06115 [Desulfomonilia bacterium]